MWESKGIAYSRKKWIMLYKIKIERSLTSHSSRQTKSKRNSSGSQKVLRVVRRSAEIIQREDFYNYDDLLYYKSYFLYLTMVLTSSLVVHSK